PGIRAIVESTRASQKKLNRSQEPCNQRGTLRQCANSYILARAVRPFADRPESIQNANAQGCGKASIRAAAGRRFAQIQADLAPQGLRAAKERLDAGRAFERRPRNPAPNLDARTLQDRPQAAQFALQQPRIREPRIAKIYFRAGAVGYHVRYRPAGNNRGLYRDAAPRIIPPHQPHDLRRKLVDGVHSLLRIDSRMRRAAADDQFGRAHALALRLQPAIGPQRWFQHQHGVAAERLPLDELSRSLAADFFIRVPQEHQPLAGLNAQRPQRIHREERHHVPRLHVERSGPPGAPARKAERHRANRPHGVYRVEMAEHHDLPSAAGELAVARRYFRANMVAAFALPEDVNARAAAAPFARDDFAESVHGRLIAA